jgi:hypothetical protein
MTTDTLTPTPAELLDFMQNAWTSAMKYEDYRQLGRDLHARGLTTGPVQNESLLEYSKMNEQRMNRLDKTVVIGEELQRVLSEISKPQRWLLITEHWCGDAAQNVPAIAKAAAGNPFIDLRLILRDEHPEIMQHFLTNGGTAIPVLIIMDESNRVLARWAPRPAPAQAMVMGWKHAPEPKISYSELAAEIHSWYAKDKTLTLQKELVELLDKVND